MGRHKDMTMSDLAIASLLFSSLTPYNTSLLKLRSDTGDKLDLDIPLHREAAVEWLNDWGCRHLPKEHHGVASESIGEWYKAHCRSLFPDDKPLWQLDEGELSTATSAYGDLKDRLGALRDRGGKRSETHIGPTAASKILFAIRPEALMPWDREMRRHYDCDGSLESYSTYLMQIKELTLHIESLCSSKGFEIGRLPQRLGRPERTVLELVNEYLWVTVTKNVRLPSSQTLTQWASLA